MNEETYSTDLTDFPRRELIDSIEQVFVGKTEVVEKTAICLLADGHLLLEDVPGVGKTTLATALAASIGTSFNRIQFTSDLLPSDIVGVNVYRSNTETFEFIKGPLFAGVVLADELNRTPPRTQSALLEAMDRAKVTVENETFDLPAPFHVIATQNPTDQHGTYPLPENQLDRFLMRLSIGYPDRPVEASLVKQSAEELGTDQITPVLSNRDWTHFKEQVPDVDMKDSLVAFLLDITRATRQHDAIRTGISTRGVLAFARLARASALFHGRDFCIPRDIIDMAQPALTHRLELTDTETDHRRREASAILDRVISDLDVPVE